jgi:hypothetical protein
MKTLVHVCRCLVYKYPKLQMMFSEDDLEEDASYSTYRGEIEDPQITNALNSHVFWELSQLKKIPDQQLQSQLKAVAPKRTEVLKPPIDFWREQIYRHSLANIIKK